MLQIPLDLISEKLPIYFVSYAWIFDLIVVGVPLLNGTLFDIAAIYASHDHLIESLISNGLILYSGPLDLIYSLGHYRVQKVLRYEPRHYLNICS